MKDVIDLVGIWLREPPLDPATFGSIPFFCLGTHNPAILKMPQPHIHSLQAQQCQYCQSYLIFVIFFTLAKVLENKIYTEKRQFFALNL